MTTLYTKNGRRYVVFGNADYSADVMRVGEFRLTYCYTDGGRRYRYDVRPDTASFLAACEVAEEAMERAIRDAAIAKAVPRAYSLRPYTSKQLEIVERFRVEMSEAGGLIPEWWLYNSARDIAKAGIEAVRNYGVTHE